MSVAGPNKESKEIHGAPAAEADMDDSHSHSAKQGVDLSNEVYDLSQIDPILAQKMALINATIDEIGMTSFQWKLFALNGFGYAVDSLLIVCNTVCHPLSYSFYTFTTELVAMPHNARRTHLFLLSLSFPFSSTHDSWSGGPPQSRRVCHGARLVASLGSSLGFTNFELPDRTTRCR
jgi:hypothetical protein